MYDLLICNAQVVDGSGAPGYPADIAIEQGTIAAIEQGIPPQQAQRVIDAHGLVVSPGFIDIHSHSDTYFLQDNRGEAKLYQGVTTELAGQCGSTIHPCPPQQLERLREFAGSDVAEYASASFSEFLQKVKDNRKDMGTNLVPLVGHGALRLGVMGYENRPATAQELAQMCQLLEADMAAGAWGLSLGLGYTPGISSTQEELCALGQVVAKHKGLVTSHMRNQGLGTPESLEEMYEINRRSGAHVHIAHFKASGRAAWGKAPDFAAHLHRAQAQGIHVTADVYPYTAASSGITNSFPKWSIQGGKQVALAMLRDPAQRGKLMDALEQSFATPEDGKALYVVTTDGRYPIADGKDIWQLSQELGLSMAETAAQVALETDAHATCISFAMSEEDVEFMLRQQDFAIGSDGYCLPLDPALNRGKPHPRSFGTFPRFLRLAREKKLCSLEQAVHRITGLPAQYIGLPQRGLLRQGYVADLTIFDPDTIADRATYENPFQSPLGIHHVVLNGQIALENGKQTDLRLGQFILNR